MRRVAPVTGAPADAIALAADRDIVSDKAIPLLTIAALALAAAAVAEFSLLRVLLRMGPELPEGAAVDAGLRWVYRVGLWSLNLAGALGLVVVASLVVTGARARLPGRLATAVAGSGAVFLIVFAWFYARLAGDTDATMLAAQVLGLSLAFGAVWFATLWRGWKKAWLAAICAAYLAGATNYLARLAAASDATSISLAAGEAFAVAAALAAPWALGARWDWRAAAAGAVVAMLYMGFAVAHPAIARFFVIWDSGFGSAAPPALQAAAMAALVYTVTALLLRRERLLAVAGLTLVALGGLKLDYTYYSLLAVAGFVLLAASPWLEPDQRG